MAGEVALVPKQPSGCLRSGGRVVQGVEELSEGDPLFVVLEGHGGGQCRPPVDASATAVQQDLQRALGFVSGEDLVGGDTMQRWSGREARLLRGALRMSLRDFAAYLGVSDRIVSNWESGGASYQPRAESQAVLDTALGRASDDAKDRFAAALGTNGAAPPVAGRIEVDSHKFLPVFIGVERGRQHDTERGRPVDGVILGPSEPPRSAGLRPACLRVRGSRLPPRPAARAHRAHRTRRLTRPLLRLRPALGTRQALRSPGRGPRPHPQPRVRPVPVLAHLRPVGRRRLRHRPAPAVHALVPGRPRRAERARAPGRHGLGIAPRHRLRPPGHRALRRTRSLHRLRRLVRRRLRLPFPRA